LEYRVCPICGIWPDPARWSFGRSRFKSTQR
jgi:hypothetical protein